MAMGYLNSALHLDAEAAKDGEEKEAVEHRRHQSTDENLKLPTGQHEVKNEADEVSGVGGQMEGERA
eukprot:1869168-Rhodomonas_salina.4